MAHRPGGVLALALIFIIVAAIGIIAGIHFLVYEVPGFQSRVQNDFLFALLVNISPTPPSPLLTGVTAWIVFVDVPASLSNMSTYTYSALVALVIFGIYFLSGVGLLYMKKWAYYLALFIGVSDIIAGIVLLIFIVGIFPLVFGIILLVYLLRDVRYEFEQG